MSKFTSPFLSLLSKEETIGNEFLMRTLANVNMDKNIYKT